MSECLANSMDEHQLSAASKEAEKEQNSLSEEEKGGLEQESVDLATAVDGVDSANALMLELDDPDDATPIASRSVALEDSGVIPFSRAAGTNGVTPLSLVEENGNVAQRNPYKHVLSFSDHENHPSVGTMLRHFRQEQGKSIQDIAQSLCARATTIADIENDKLNYRNCMNFASNIIRRYAEELGFMPDLLVDMYQQAVLRNDPITESDKRDSSENKGSGVKKWLFGLVGLLVIAGGVCYYFFGQKETSSEELIMSTNGSQNLEPLDDAFSITPVDNNVIAAANKGEIIELGHISDESVAAANAAAAATTAATAAAAGATAGNTNSPSNALGNDKASAVVIETDGNPFLEGSKVNTSEKVVATEPKEAPAALTPVLSLPQEVPTSDGQGLLRANVDHGALLTDTSVNAQAKVNTSAQDSLADKKKVDQQLKVAAEQMQALQAQSGAASANDAIAAKDNVSPVSPVSPVDAKVTANNEVAPAGLDNKLKNISSRVKIVNRDALGSLNRVNITVNSNVSLRVLDGSKKVLAQGSFKKGDTITATGIPPLTVQTSNTRALEISYSGGQLRMPREQQVQFELPMR